jgi:hypothetical protein
MSILAIIIGFYASMAIGAALYDPHMKRDARTYTLVFGALGVAFLLA